MMPIKVTDVRVCNVTFNLSFALIFFHAAGHHKDSLC